MRIKTYPLTKKDSIGNVFSRLDSGIEDFERFIIFFSEYKINKLLTMSAFVVNGTFKTSENIFYRFLVVLGFFRKIFTIRSYSYKNKTEISYFSVFIKCK